MKIVIDAMGSDNGAEGVVKGLLMVLGEIDSHIVIFGDEKEIKEQLNKLASKKQIEVIKKKVEIVHADEVITNDDESAMSIKSKKESSMVNALQYLKTQDDACLISAGSTGALMSGSIIFLGRIKDVARPALSPILPTYDAKGFLLVDAGANVNTTEEQLTQFAKMGTVYMKCIRHIERPRISLLNVGTEEKKGTEYLQKVYQNLKADHSINFIGNIEGRDIFNGDTDVVVCSGLLGNITLKTTEGIGMMIKKLLKEELTSKWYYLPCMLILKPALKAFTKRIDYTEYGGALLLGIKKAVIKCHGSSNGKAFASTIKQAEEIIKNKVVANMIANMEG